MSCPFLILYPLIPAFSLLNSNGVNLLEYSHAFAKNASGSGTFGENSSKISAGGVILGKDARV